MARLPRLVVPDCPHHVIQRGNNRQAVFFSEEDYCVYLDWLGEAALKHGCAIHAYVLMTNHVHLLATPEDVEGIGMMMQTLGRRYVRYINGKYHRSGTLWEGRYKSSLVDSEAYLLRCYRYIELNPVRAGMVDMPGEYPWSSYSTNAHGISNTLLTQHAVYERLGNTEKARLQHYRSLFSEPLGMGVVKDIRESVQSGWVLGDARFREQIEAQLKRRAGPAPRGGDRKSERYLRLIKLH